MRLSSFLLLGLLVACSRVDGTKATQSIPDARKGEVLQSSTCMKKTDIDRLSSGPVSDADARRLARHYGICLSDGAGEERWLRVLATRGDKQAMADLASLLRYQPGRDAEAKRWADASTAPAH